MSIPELKSLAIGVKLHLRKATELESAVHSFLLDTSEDYLLAYNNNDDASMKQQRIDFLLKN